MKIINCKLKIVLPLLLLLFLLFSPPPSAHAGIMSRPNSPGLVAYWDFNELSGATAYDRSIVNTNNGTLTNGPTRVSSQAGFGRALSFDGSNDYVEVADSPSLVFTTGLTVSFWLYSKATPAVEYDLVEKRVAGTNGEFTVIQTSADRISLYAGANGGGAGGWQVTDISPTQTISLNRWYHVTATISTLATAVYIDGVQGATGAGITFSDSTEAVRIGNHKQNTYHLNGVMDDVRIYNRALSAAEVLRLYNTTKPAVQQKVATLAPSISCRAGVVSSGLVGYWSFDNVSGTTAPDCTRNKNNGTLTNSPTVVGGKIGKAVSFDAASACTVVGNVAPLQITGNKITLSEWIYPTTSFSGVRMTIGKYGNTSSNTAGYGMYFNGSGVLNFIISTTGSDAFITSSASTLNLNQWYHVVGVYDGAKMQIYINGIADGTPTTNTGNIFNTSSRFALGCDDDQGTLQQFYNGRIDDARVYNRALSVSEIKQIYNATASINKEAPNNGLVGLWKFDEGSGTTALDMSGSGNKGTLTNSPTYVTGKFGKALRFNGSTQYVDVADNPSLRPGTGSWSFAYWFNAANSAQYGPVVSKRDPSSFNQIQTGIGYITGGGSPVSDKTVYMFSYSGFTSYHTTNNVVDGKWHHVVAIRPSSGAMQIYIDGVSAALTTDADSGVVNVNNTTSVKIGFESGSSYFNGLVDDVRIYNRALSAAEVLQIYKSR